MALVHFNNFVSAKLHALLNSNIQVAHSTKQQTPVVPTWEPNDESLSEDSR